MCIRHETRLINGFLTKRTVKRSKKSKAPASSAESTHSNSTSMDTEQSGQNNNDVMCDSTTASETGDGLDSTIIQVTAPPDKS